MVAPASTRRRHRGRAAHHAQRLQLRVAGTHPAGRLIDTGYSIITVSDTRSTATKTSSTELDQHTRGRHPWPAAPASERPAAAPPQRQHCEAGRCGPAQPCAIGDGGVPDEEVLDFINAAERDAGTYLYGRTMCEMMVGWETDPAVAGSLPRARSSPRSGRPRRRSSSRAHWSRCPQRTRIKRSFVRASSKRSRPRQVGTQRLQRRRGCLGVARRRDRRVSRLRGADACRERQADVSRQPSPTLETGEMLNLNDELFSRPLGESIGNLIELFRAISFVILAAVVVVGF
jgi:hypothetical protein